MANICRAPIPQAKATLVSNPKAGKVTYVVSQGSARPTSGQRYPRNK